MCEPDLHVDTPVGERCLWCEEVVDDGDAGIMMGVATLDGYSSAPEHCNCFLRQTVGSVGHQLGLCSCFNPDPDSRFDDPEGMSKRDAADAAMELFERQGYVRRRFLER